MKLSDYKAVFATANKKQTDYVVFIRDTFFIKTQVQIFKNTNIKLGYNQNRSWGEGDSDMKTHSKNPVADFEKKKKKK